MGLALVTCVESTFRDCVCNANNTAMALESIFPQATALTAHPHSDQSAPPTSLALVDSGSTHVLLHDKDVDYPAVTRVVHKPLDVAFGNGTQATSTATAILSVGPIKVPAHMFPSAVLSNELLGMAPFTKQGCVASIDNTTVIISKEAQAILSGHKLPADSLWLTNLAQLPAPVLQHSSTPADQYTSRAAVQQCSNAAVQQNSTAAEQPSSGAAEAHADPQRDYKSALLNNAAPSQQPASGNLAFHTEGLQHRVGYLSALLGNAADSTLLRSLSKGWMSASDGWPAVTPAQFTKHAPNSQYTAQGHLVELRYRLKPQHQPHRPAQANLSIAAQPTEPPLPADAPQQNSLPTTDEPDEYNWVALVNFDDFHAAFHGDLKGPHPRTSKRGNKHVLVVVCNNFMHLEAVSSKEGKIVADAYERSLNFYANRGVYGRFLRIDNSSSPHLRALLAKRRLHGKALELEFVPPGIHRGNKAEKSIQFMEAMYLSTLAGADPTFPPEEWDEMLEQLEITCAHLMPWGPDPSLSAWHGLHGQRYNFNNHPFAPWGIKISKQIDRKNRPSYSFKAKKGFYLGPAAQHKRCHRVLVKNKANQWKAEIDQQLAFHPHDGLRMPRITPSQELALALQDWTATLARVTNPQRRKDLAGLPLDPIEPSLLAQAQASLSLYVPAHLTLQQYISDEESTPPQPSTQPSIPAAAQPSSSAVDRQPISTTAQSQQTSAAVGQHSSVASAAAPQNSKPAQQPAAWPRQQPLLRTQQPSGNSRGRFRVSKPAAAQAAIHRPTALQCANRYTALSTADATTSDSTDSNECTDCDSAPAATTYPSAAAQRVPTRKHQRALRINNRNKDSAALVSRMLAAAHAVTSTASAPAQRVDYSTCFAGVTVSKTGTTVAPRTPYTQQRVPNTARTNTGAPTTPTYPAFTAAAVAERKPPTTPDPATNVDPPLLQKILDGSQLSDQDFLDWRTWIRTNYDMQSDTDESHCATANENAAKPTFSLPLNLQPDGTPLTYRSAMRGPNKDEWLQSDSREIDRLFTLECMEAVSPQDVPPGKTATYYNPQVKEKVKIDSTTMLEYIERRVRGAIGGDRLHPTGPTTCNTAETEVLKAFFNKVASERGIYFTMDAKDFYLGTPMPPGEEEYVNIPLRHFTDELLDRRNLRQFVHNGRIVMRIKKTIYGLRNAGRLSKEKLDRHLADAGYFEDTLVPCIYRHTSNGMLFVLVVDDFACTCKDQSAKEHLLTTLREAGYIMTVDHKGAKFVGLTVDYQPELGWLDISMPGYVDKLLTRFAHRTIVPCSSPIVYTAPIYGAKAQLTTPPDVSDILTDEDAHEIQEIIGCCLWYSRMTDLPTLPAVSMLSTDQSDRRSSIQHRVDRLLGHLKKYPNNRIRYFASDMKYHCYSDVSYLNVTRGRSRAGGIGFFGWNNNPSRINGAVSVLCKVLDVVVSSVCEGEYGAAYMVARNAVWMRAIARALGYPQGATTILVDNTCAVGLSNDTLKTARTKAIDVRFHWLRDRVRQDQFNVVWVKSEDNLADFFTKALPVHAHLARKEQLVVP
jgi:hypothetical protein